MTVTSQDIIQAAALIRKLEQENNPDNDNRIADGKIYLDKLLELYNKQKETASSEATKYLQELKRTAITPRRKAYEQMFNLQAEGKLSKEQEKELESLFVVLTTFEKAYDSCSMLDQENAEYARVIIAFVEMMRKDILNADGSMPKELMKEQARMIDRGMESMNMLYDWIFNNYIQK
jgi:hypothetical protein